MATGKNKKENQGSIDIRFRSSVRNDMVSMDNDSDKNEPHISGVVFFAVLVVCVVLIIAIPALAIMYVDMNNATNAAIVETRKMKELRLKILTEGQ